MGCTISSGTHPDGTRRGVDLRLCGLDQTHFLDYLTITEMQPGTTIQIELIDSGTPDQPSRRLADRNRDENREREDFEWAKNKYFELKHKYE